MSNRKRKITLGPVSENYFLDGEGRLLDKCARCDGSGIYNHTKKDSGFSVDISKRCPYCHGRGGTDLIMGAKIGVAKKGVLILAIPVIPVFSAILMILGALSTFGLFSPLVMGVGAVGFFGSLVIYLVLTVVESPGLLRDMLDQLEFARLKVTALEQLIEWQRLEGPEQGEDEAEEAEDIQPEEEPKARARGGHV